MITLLTLSMREVLMKLFQCLTYQDAASPYILFLFLLSSYYCEFCFGGFRPHKSQTRKQTNYSNFSTLKIKQLLPVKWISVHFATLSEAAVILCVEQLLAGWIKACCQGSNALNLKIQTIHICVDPWQNFKKI